VNSEIDMQLREMTAADMDAVLQIEQQIHSHPWTRGMFSDSLSGGYLCKVYGTSQEIVGYAVLMPVLDEVHLLDIGIAAARQRKGMGYKLFNIIKELYINRKFVRVLLEVRRSNLAAIALYRKAGFEQIGERRDYYPANNGREDALVMELKIK
jgi:[ribosomal protein S18]-alanine N-acetyltransferase